MVEREFPDNLELTLIELAQASGLSGAEISELVELGVFDARRSESKGWLFSANSLSLARTACRLREDFDLNTPGIALALTYLEKIEALQARLRELECQILK
jgi:chaperone modulatory protein CbpM